MHYLSVIIDNNQRRPLSSLCTNGNLQQCKTLKMKTTFFLSSVVFHNKTFIFTFLKQHLIYQYSSCPLSSKYLVQKRTFRNGWWQVSETLSTEKRVCLKEFIIWTVPGFSLFVINSKGGRR